MAKAWPPLSDTAAHARQLVNWEYALPLLRNLRQHGKARDGEALLPIGLRVVWCPVSDPHSGAEATRQSEAAEVIRCARHLSNRETIRARRLFLCG